ncbi:hypothetical protein [Lysobacter sp. Root690]|uniref:hypothetical protein n=1 Tax=Lysobacter sp. Root690 TaxID=1736588 RepID=UPI000AEB8357|nr:hypothetical protein [Lysobacter sp. Root690]
MKRLLMLVPLLLAGLAFWYFDLARRIDEAAVRDYYNQQMQAYYRFDGDWFCTSMTDDYEVVEITYTGKQRKDERLNKAESCKRTRETVAELVEIRDAKIGLPLPSWTIEVKNIEVADDRHSATVQAEGRMTVGARDLGVTKWTERLIRRNGRVFSERSDSTAWVEE